MADGAKIKVKQLSPHHVLCHPSEMAQVSSQQHIRQLCTELLDDIELSRLPSDQLVMKCSRLARLAGTDEAKSWLSFEMHGYSSGDLTSIKYMDLTSRWTNKAKEEGLWGSLATQEGIIKTQTIELEASRLESISSEYALPALNAMNNRRAALTQSITRLNIVRSKVVALMHNFVTAVYYENAFANFAETTFENFRSDVDALIGQRASNAMDKIPAISARLREGDTEAVSQALTTCRRVLEAFADAILPSSTETFDLDGNTVNLGASNHQNRINVYIHKHVKSASRKKRLRQNLANLFDRVSTGVHKDIGHSEALALFLNVYLFLGEIVKLPVVSPAE